MKIIPLIRILAVAASAVWFTSCDGGGSSSSSSGGGSGGHDFGENDKNLIICIGDSITDGDCVPAGAPYPSRLAGLSGKSVINAGSCGEKSSSTAARAPGLLARHKPGYICILIGANDATAAFSGSHVAENIRLIIQAAKAQKTIPLVATLTPTDGPHIFSNDNCQEISAAIRAMVKQEHVRLVDLEYEFGDGSGLLQEDGLHPNSAGNQIMAAAFNDKL